MYLCNNFKLLLYKKDLYIHLYIILPKVEGNVSQKLKQVIVLKSQIHWTEVGLFDVLLGTPQHFGK